MAPETPDDDATPRIAILGAGPIGLEAALYARYLGFDVAIFERQTVAANVRRWGHVTMFSPFRLNRSSLGVAALRAQDDNVELPPDDELLTGEAYYQRYLAPLSRSDLLDGCIFEGVRVKKVGRDGILKSDLQNVDRADYCFRLLLDTDAGEEVTDADFVIDATGVYNQPNHLGHGGIPAIGESEVISSIDFDIPDVLGRDRDRFANTRTLVVGGGYSAATTIVALGELCKSSPATEAVWITRRATPESGPIHRLDEDRLVQRDRLAQAANELARSESGISHRPQTTVTAIRRENGRFIVTLAGQQIVEEPFDHVVAHVGFRPDDSLYAELQVHQCYASQGPMKLAASLLEAESQDCLDQISAGPDSLSNPSPGSSSLVVRFTAETRTSCYRLASNRSATCSRSLANAKTWTCTRPWSTW